MSCGVGHRRSLDHMLLWLWYRPMAAAPIRPVAWGPPYAAGVALQKTKRKKKKERQISYCISYVESYVTDEPICRTEKDSQTWRADLWLPKERGREWGG